MFLTLYGNIKTAEQRTIIQQYGDWYTGRWWVGRYIWYSEEGPGRAAAPPSPLLAVPNITAHPSTASVLTSYYSMWHGRQRRGQEDPVSLLSGRLEKTTRSSPHHVAQHRPTGSETTPPYAPRSSRFGSELPSVEDDVDVRNLKSCMPETTTTVIAFAL